MGNQKLEILRESLVEKNATFLFGAGASAPYFGSLGNFEKILSDENISWQGKALIKTIFYDLSIKDNIYLANFINDDSSCSSQKDLMLSIINEYSRFIHNSIEYLKVRNSRISPKRINIITTNYDLFIESAIDRILETNPRVFFNDGTNGYGKRILSSDNFNKTLLYTGIFDNYSNEMPNINLIKCHGSVNWKEHKEETGRSKIQVLIEQNLLSSINEELDTTLTEIKTNIDNGEFQEVNSYEELISQMNEVINADLIRLINSIGEYSQYSLKLLMSKIETLQIVLPTKKKFQTTLIEEHYFNMLRLVSYELEKKQSLLVVFGFSFNDEHIRDVIQRSLNNPNLLVIIFCFTDNDEAGIISQFNFSPSNIPVNIIFITPNDFLVKEVESDEFSIDEDDRLKYTIIENENRVFIYSKVVSILTNNNGESIPVINFSSFNSILEENITNKFIFNNVGEPGDDLE
jgi:hypothetical protein